MENTENFELKSILPALNMLMGRMTRVEDKIYLDLRPTSCLCAKPKERYEQIVSMLETFVELARLFGSAKSEINILIDYSGGGPVFLPISINQAEFGLMCNQLPKVNGVNWIPVKSFRKINHEKNCIWGTLE